MTLVELHGFAGYGHQCDAQVAGLNSKPDSSDSMLPFEEIGHAVPPFRDNGDSRRVS